MVRITFIRAAYSCTQRMMPLLPCKFGGLCLSLEGAAELLTACEFHDVILYCTAFRSSLGRGSTNAFAISGPPLLMLVGRQRSRFLGARQPIEFDANGAAPWTGEHCL